MGIFVDAVTNKKVTYDNGATTIDTSYNLGDGYHKVKISGSSTNVAVGEGHTIVKHYGDNATITAGDGYKKITSLGDNKSITTGDGDDDVVFIGDNVKLDTGKGNDKLVLWGNNCNVKTGEGDDKVTTFDKVYKEDKYAPLADDFLNRLEEGTHDDWKLKSSDLIDYWVTKHTSHGFFKNKTTITQHYVYENHYNVDTILSKYVNMKNTTIDMGDGDDESSVTIGDNSTITASNTENISKNNKYSIDKTIATRDEVQLKYYEQSHSRSSWGLGACMTLGFFTGPYGFIAGTAVGLSVYNP